VQRRQLILAPAAAALAACARSPPSAPDIDAWADAFALDWLRQSPQFATSAQLLPLDEQAELDGQLNDLSLAQREARVAQAREGLRGLGNFSGQTFTPMQRTSAATMQWGLVRTVESATDADHNFIFNQNGGLHLQQVNLLSENQPLRRAADLPAFLSRLAQMPRQLDQGIQRARDAMQKGLLPPRFIAERARGQLQALLNTRPEDNAIVAGLARRSATIKDLSPEARTQALERARLLVQDGMRPAWQRVLVLFDELLPRTGDAAGLSRLPGGEAVYARALVANTTSTLTPEQVHSIGLAEVARIEAEMDSVLRKMGRSSGSVREREAALQRELQPAAEPDPRPALLERYAAAVRDAQARSLRLFNMQPQAPVEVRRVPALTERTASAYYTTAAKDGSRPGIFWAPLPGPNFDILGMRTLAIHEAVPGHHFQLALQQEMLSLPRWRRVRLFGGGSAHSEGWGLYAERLAIEQGWYDDDAPGLVGAWSKQLFRARRLVVDTGLHSKGWSRQRAIDYGIAANEVERYVANPGQACAYMIGMQRILALRQQAQTRLGARFTLPGFHDVVLRTGSVPMDVLGDVLQQWQGA
jgi:uncharacterized protein (DUF885 family)